MVMNTLLTTPLTSEQQKAIEEREQLWDKAHVIALNIWLEGYKAGDISLEHMIKQTHAALNKISLPERQKQLLLGVLVNDALSIAKPKRTRGTGKTYPTALKKISAILVDSVSNREKLSKSRYSPEQTAFEKVSLVLNDCGFEVSPNTLINWYSEYRE
jgi:hypothetical protein